MPPTDDLVDFERPARLAARQGQALAGYVAAEAYPFSRFDRARLDKAGLGRRGVRSVGDLRRLPPVSVAELGDGAAATLYPGPDALRAHGPWRLRARWWVAGLTGRHRRLVDEELEPRFKPVVWLRQGELAVGYTTTDLDLLADLGRRWLAAAGVRADDRVVALGGIADGLAGWQLSLGCRAGGVPATVLDLPVTVPGTTVPGDRVAAADPTVLAGSPAALDRLAGTGARLDHLHTVLVLGALPGGSQRRRWAALAAGDGAAVVGAWAPPGVRALWGQCRGGELHTWPDAEVVEVVDPLTGEAWASGAAGGDPGGEAGEPGELVWSPTGWRGTAALRVATGAFGHLRTGSCPACGRTTPRLALVELDPPFALELDAHPEVVDWWADPRGDRLRVVVALRSGAAADEVVDGLAHDLDARVERVPLARVRLLRAAAGGGRSR